MSENSKEINEVEVPNEEQMTVTPDMLLAQIVSYIGEQFVVIPTGGWLKIVKTLQEYDPEKDGDDLISLMEGLKVPVIPISLVPKNAEDSNIITPNGMPSGDSNIILP